MTIGAIRFESIPRADVILNGECIGITPIDIIDATPGKYLYTLSVDEDTHFSNELNVYPGKITHITMDFTSNTRNEDYLDMEEPTAFEEQVEEPSEEQVEEPSEEQVEEPSVEEPSVEEAILEELKRTNELLESLRRMSEEKSPLNKRAWYDNETAIENSVPVVPSDTSSGQYQLEKVHDVLGYNSEKIFLCNDGPGILFIVTSGDGKNFSNETSILEGECKTYTNIYTIGVRSPVKGLRYRISERPIDPHSAEIFSGSRFKERRDRKGAIIFQDDMESPTLKFAVSGTAPPNAIARSTVTAFAGDFSVEIQNNSCDPGTLPTMTYRHVDSHFSRVGAQISFSPVTAFDLRLHMHRVINLQEVHSEVFIDDSGNLGIVDLNGNKTTLFAAPHIEFLLHRWNSFKLVADYNSGFYDKVILNSIVYDLSTIPMQKLSGFITDNILDVNITLFCIAAGAATVYIDNYILTEDEPK